MAGSRFALREFCSQSRSRSAACWSPRRLSPSAACSRTFTMPLGIDPEGVTLAALDTNLGGYQDDQGGAMQKRLLDAVQHIPGVTRAAYANSTPLSINQSDTRNFRPARPISARRHEISCANYYKVSPNYFAAAGTRLLCRPRLHRTRRRPCTRGRHREQTFAKAALRHGECRRQTLSDRTRPPDRDRRSSRRRKIYHLTEDPAPAIYLADRAENRQRYRPHRPLPTRPAPRCSPPSARQSQASTAATHIRPRHLVGRAQRWLPSPPAPQPSPSASSEPSR